MLEKTLFVQYNRSNNEFAKQNRKNPTQAEKTMREKILKYRPLWYKFLRQKPIDSFIADFYCSKLLLVIEIDWSSHNDKDNYDLERSKKIWMQWIKVLRYENNDILNNLSEIKQDLIKYIKTREKELSKQYLISDLP